MNIILHRLYEELYKYFDNDPKKVMQWFQANNPALGGISPQEMIKRGKSKKLLDFVLTSLADNKR